LVPGLLSEMGEPLRLNRAVSSGHNLPEDQQFLIVRQREVMYQHFFGGAVVSAPEKGFTYVPLITGAVL
jgi:hypothetical protein